MSAKNINSPESKMNVFTHEEVADSFKAGMRQFPSGITLLTSLHNGERGGLIATAFSSVSMDPPTLLTCVNKNASAHNIIYNANRICVQILSEEDLSVVSSFSDSLKEGSGLSPETGRICILVCLLSKQPLRLSTVKLWRKSHVQHTLFS